MWEISQAAFHQWHQICRDHFQHEALRMFHINKRAPTAIIIHEHRALSLSLFLWLTRSFNRLYSKIPSTVKHTKKKIRHSVCSFLLMLLYFMCLLLLLFLFISGAYFSFIWVLSGRCMAILVVTIFPLFFLSPFLSRSFSISVCSLYWHCCPVIICWIGKIKQKWYT